MLATNPEKHRSAFSMDRTQQILRERNACNRVGGVAQLRRNSTGTCGTLQDSKPDSGSVTRSGVDSTVNDDSTATTGLSLASVLLAGKPRFGTILSRKLSDTLKKSDIARVPHLKTQRSASTTMLASSYSPEIKLTAALHNSVDACHDDDNHGDGKLLRPRHALRQSSSHRVLSRSDAVDHDVQKDSSSRKNTIASLSSSSQLAPGYEEMCMASQSLKNLQSFRSNVLTLSAKHLEDAQSKACNGPPAHSEPDDSSQMDKVMKMCSQFEQQLHSALNELSCNTLEMMSSSTDITSSSTDITSSSKDIISSPLVKNILDGQSPSRDTLDFKTRNAGKASGKSSRCHRQLSLPSLAAEGNVKSLLASTGVGPGPETSSTLSVRKRSMSLAPIHSSVRAATKTLPASSSRSTLAKKIAAPRKPNLSSSSSENDVTLSGGVGDLKVTAIISSLSRMGLANSASNRDLTVKSRLATGHHRKLGRTDSTALKRHSTAVCCRHDNIPPAVHCSLDGSFLGDVKPTATGRSDSRVSAARTEDCFDSSNGGLIVYHDEHRCSSDESLLHFREESRVDLHSESTCKISEQQQQQQQQQQERLATNTNVNTPITKTTSNSNSTKPRKLRQTAAGTSSASTVLGLQLKRRPVQLPRSASAGDENAVHVNDVIMTSASHSVDHPVSSHAATGHMINGCLSGSVQRTSVDILAGSPHVCLFDVMKCDVQQLARAMSKTKSAIESFCIDRGDLDFEDILLVTSSLRRTSTVQNFRILNCPIGCIGAELLGSAVRHSDNISFFSLDNNNLGDMGLEALSTSLKHSLGLEILQLGSQNLTDSAVTSLVSIVANCKRLHSLSIDGLQFSIPALEQLQTAAKYYNISLILSQDPLPASNKTCKKSSPSTLHQLSKDESQGISPNATDMDAIVQSVAPVTIRSSTNEHKPVTRTSLARRLFHRSSAPSSSFSTPGVKANQRPATLAFPIDTSDFASGHLTASSPKAIKARKYLSLIDTSSRSPSLALSMRRTSFPAAQSSSSSASSVRHKGQRGGCLAPAQRTDSIKLKPYIRLVPGDGVSPGITGKRQSSYF
eukprot:scpid53063/ scgid15166/ 